MTILVTGGCGFIGSNFIRRFLERCDEAVVNIDKLTYAADPSINQTFKDNPLYHFYEGDIANLNDVATVLMRWQPTAVVNFAAESHVDNSISNAAPFVETNIVGTFNLLEGVRQVNPWIKFIHVSTDEVYGSLEFDDPAFTEKTPYDPRSPYSASKAASDHLVSAYHHTHGLQTIITHCSNNYGPYQYPEKLIPVIIRKALADESIPIYGTGANIRDWIFVEDHVDALIKILNYGRIGETYNIGADEEWTNLQIANKILDKLDKPKSLIAFVEDRKGHDFRYAIDNKKIWTELLWVPKHSFDEGLNKTVEWYKQNTSWVSQCLKRSESF